MSVTSALRLAEIDTVIAIKEESGDVQWFRAFMAAQRKASPNHRLAGICGGEGLFPYYAMEGASAFSTGAVNLVPNLSTAMWHAVTTSDRTRINAIQEQLAPLTSLRSKPGRSIPVIKEGLRQLGVFSTNACRPPLTELPVSECAEMEAILQAWRYVGI